jgi:hypothetical protein
LRKISKAITPNFYASETADLAALSFFRSSVETRKDLCPPTIGSKQKSLYEWLFFKIILTE